MVGLPSVESREMILRTLLSKEKVEDLDYKELAVMTEGYSGSDLKVCSLLRKCSGSIVAHFHLLPLHLFEMTNFCRLYPGNRICA